MEIGTGSMQENYFWESSLPCSKGSIQFRATFISIVLFQGAYVWIKFRDRTKVKVYRRPVLKDKLTGAIIKFSKPEARYTPPGQSGNSLYLGRCATDEEARIKRQIAAFFYGRDEGKLDLGYGQLVQIPWVQREVMEQEVSSLAVLEMRDWVKLKVKEVYEEFVKERYIVHQIYAFYHGKDEGHLDLPDGKPFLIPPMSQHEAECITGLEKENCIKKKVGEAYEEFKKERAILSSGVHDRDERVNSSHLESNRSVEEFPIPSEVAFDNDFGIEDVPIISLEKFPDIVAQPQQPFERAQAQGPASGTHTSGEPVNACTVDGNAQYDSEASRLPTESSIPLSPQQRSNAEAVLMDMITELQRKDTDKEQRLQDCLQTNEALRQTNEVLKQMLEARDRRISELELENLCLKRTLQ